ncbi:DNA polymerase III subunit gamma/tau [Flavobacteriales bacterium]|nr:DNA polymerase III subunit gamma/tau [Flavobacteriales bacterium]
MSEFVVSARKYRPNSFDSVVGQNSITSTLENAIYSGQMAQAYLFCGPRGVGKTSCARIFAKIINKDFIAEGEDLSFNVFELDAASNNSVEDIRYITDQVRIPPQVGKYKVYIIDEVHMLSSQAFNAFLKTLEEPPPHAIFILATTEKHKIIPTILSRCQVYNFNRIQVEDMVAHLEKIAQKEGITYEKEALFVIAEKADGALRDSLSIFDQIVNFSNRNITYKSVIDNLNVLDYNYYFKLVDSINKGDISSCLLIFSDILSHGFDGHHFITGLGSHFRDLLVSKDLATVELLEVSDSVKEKYIEQSKSTDIRLLIKGLEIISDSDTNYKTSKNHRLLVELTLIKLCSLSQGEQKKNPVVKKETSTEIPIQKNNNSLSSSENQDSQSISVKETREEINIPSYSVPIETEEEIINKESPVVVKETEEIIAPVSIINEKSDNTEVKKKVIYSGFSIKQTIKKQEEEIEEEERKDKDDFTFDELMIHWNQFAKDADEKNRKTLCTALTKTQPVLEDNYMIIHTLDNKPLYDNFNKEKQDFLDFLKKKLNNFSISIQSKLEKNENSEVFLYTDKEKFKKFAEQHPELLYLKEKLHLDFEF